MFLKTYHQANDWTDYSIYSFHWHRAFLMWAEVPGRDVAVIDKLAPQIRFPLVRVCPADPSIKKRLGRLVQRSTVVKALVA